MARRPRTDFAGAFHHVINRGTAQTSLFRSDDDRQRFISLLPELATRFGVETHAVVLMTNHYHLLLRSMSGELSDAMQWFNTTTAMGFNSRHGRSGALFQGRFTSRLIDSDDYLEAVAHYVHLNPVDAGLIADPTAYRWSSLPSYAGIKKTPVWLHTDVVLAGRSSTEFLEAMRRARPSLPVVGDRHLAADAHTDGIDGADVIEERVAQLFCVSVDEIHRPSAGRSNPARTIAIVLADELTSASEAAVAARYGLSDRSAVRHARRRLAKLVDRDPLVSRIVQDLRSAA